MANKTYIQFVIDANSTMFSDAKLHVAFGFLASTVTQLVVKESKTTEVGLGILLAGYYLLSFLCL